ncbi:MAG: response regulator [Chloroflexi bacterium]|nr:response regulator [Chloroflexota bacterium]
MSNAQILVVEDESIAATHIQRALKSLGYEVPVVIDTGEEAIIKAGEILPDLVLMDIILKGKMDGVEAAEQIRSSYDIPVIYLTASSDSSTFQRAKVTEPFGYILKPFEESVLRTTIEIALYKHEIESNLKQKSEEVEALYAVARILAQSWNFEEKCKGVLEALSQIARADMTTMRVLDPNDKQLHLVASAGAANWNRPESLPLEGSISGKAFQGREPVVVNDLLTYPLKDPVAIEQGIRSLLSLPIRADRWTLGVINLASRNPNQFSPKLVNLLSGIADGLGSL